MKEYDETNNLLKANDVALMLNVHINTIRRWSNQGLLNAQRIGPRGDRRFSKEEIDRFIKEGHYINHTEL
jgi:excisionase family DNA binding protein